MLISLTDYFYDADVSFLRNQRLIIKPGLNK